MRLFFLTGTRIGDAVLSMGLLDHLLRTHPGIRVTVAVGPLAAPLFRSLPGLERLLVLSKRKDKLHWLLLWRTIAARRWTVAADLRSSALTRFILARRRIVTDRADHNEHRVVELGRLIGQDPPPAPRLWLSEADRAAAGELLPPGRPVLALAPTASWPGKEWPLDRFIALARRLTAPDGCLPGASVAVFGGPGESDRLRPLLDAGIGGGVIDLVGRLELPVVGACLERASLFVGNDSGLMHIAAASGAPTLGLFGPSPDARYAPWGRRTAVARTDLSYEALLEGQKDRWDASGNPMNTLSVDKAAAAALTLLARCADPAPV